MHSKSSLILIYLLSSLISTSQIYAQIPFTSEMYFQDFDSIGTEAMAQLPDGYRVDFKEAGGQVGSFVAAGNITTRRGGNLLPSTAAPGIYNFGSGDSTKARDRAIGFIFTSNQYRAGNLYAKFMNQTGRALNGVQLGRQIELYRGGLTNTVIRVYVSFNDSTYFFTRKSSGGTGVFREGHEDTGSLIPASHIEGFVTFEPPVPPGNCFYVAFHFFVPVDTTGSPRSAAFGLDNFYIAGGASDVGGVWTSALEREFPDQTVNTTSDSLQIIVHARAFPRAPTPSFTLSGQNPDDFLVAPDAGSGEMTRFKIFFTPLATGQRTALLTFTSHIWPSKPVLLSGTGTIQVSVHDDISYNPRRFDLFQNYPNPFNTETVIRYQIPQDGRVELSIFNNLGQKVRSLISGLKHAGLNQVRWDGVDDIGRPAPSGIYLYHLRYQKFAQARKTILLR